MTATKIELNACLKCGCLHHFQPCDPPTGTAAFISTPCPACGLPSLYNERINRCIHTGGEPNEDCWLACMQERTIPNLHQRLDRLIYRSYMARRRRRTAA